MTKEQKQEQWFKLLHFKKAYGLTLAEIGRELFPQRRYPSKAMQACKSLDRPLPKDWKSTIKNRWNYEIQ